MPVCLAHGPCLLFTFHLNCLFCPWQAGMHMGGVGKKAEFIRRGGGTGGVEGRVRWQAGRQGRGGARQAQVSPSPFLLANPLSPPPSSSLPSFSHRHKKVEGV